LPLAAASCHFFSFCISHYPRKHPMKSPFYDLKKLKHTGQKLTNKFPTQECVGILNEHLLYLDA
jgi:hypothetical protein